MDKDEKEKRAEELMFELRKSTVALLLVKLVGVLGTMMNNVLKSENEEELDKAISSK